MIRYEEYQYEIRNEKTKYAQMARDMFCVLSRPSIVYGMTEAIRLGLPPLASVCKILESKFDCSDVYIRQIAGRQIKCILNKLGYVIANTDARNRIPDRCRGKYFKTGSLYVQVRDSNYTFRIIMEER